MIARQATPDLHPAQCRSDPKPAADNRRGAVCGADLSRERPSRSREDAASLEVLLALQQRLDALLSAHGPSRANSCGKLVPVAQYFIDLRIVASLVLSSWPEAGPYAPTAALAQAIELEAVRRQRAVRRPKKTAAKKTPAPVTSLFAPMESALSAGAVLAVAERLLDGRENRWTRMAMEPICHKAAENSRGEIANLTQQPGSSFGLRVALRIEPEPQIPAEDVYVRLEPRNG